MEESEEGGRGRGCFNCISMSGSSENVLVPQQQPREQQSAGCREERPPHRERRNGKNTENYKYLSNRNTHLPGTAARRLGALSPPPHDCVLLAAQGSHAHPCAPHDSKAIFLSRMRQEKKKAAGPTSHHVFITEAEV